MSMDRRPFFVAGCCLALVLVSLFSGNAFAQVSCSGIAAFQSCTAYASGAKLVYNNSLYHTIAPIPSNRDCPPNSPYNPANDNWWVNDGTCSGGAATPTATTPPGATATKTPTATATSNGTGAVANGLYTVTNTNSGKCLDASNAGTANGTIVQQWTCNGSAAQQWQFTGTDSGYFKVATHNNTGQVLDVNGGTTATADGVKITLWSSTGGTNQQFQPVLLSGSSYKLIARHSAKCMDVNGASTADGVQMQQWTCNGTAAQSFSIAAANPVPTQPPPAPTPTTPPSTGGGSKHAPYADISLASGENIVANVSAAGLKGVTLAFLVDGGCTANWGGLGGNVSNANFPNGTSVASAISSLSANGVSVIISWGGAFGSIQSSCGTASQVQAMYQSVFNAYPSIAGQDFDIEGGINNTVVAQALAGLKAANPSKSISLTLPVLSSGLVSAGLNIVNACHSAGFHPDSVNVMAMDMGSANDNGGNMLLSSEQAATNTHNQTGDNVGITPMIGVNDTTSEIFTLQNATDLVNWAKGQSYVNRLAFWSLGRDNGGCAGGAVSPTCSSISQSTWQFSSIFNGF
jgi:hypothetical protein